jgi:ABC-type multidrug transport system fused ATPase/permease subunit
MFPIGKIGIFTHLQKKLSLNNIVVFVNFQNRSPKTRMETTNVEIAFEGLCYTVKAKKGTRALLRQVSAKIEAGKMTAIMGPSGESFVKFFIIFFINR